MISLNGGTQRLQGQNFPSKSVTATLIALVYYIRAGIGWLFGPQTVLFTVLRKKPKTVLSSEGEV